MTDSKPFFTDPEPLLVAVARLFVLEGAAREVTILANADVTVARTSYDNWNGGTTGHSLYLEVPSVIQGQISSDIENCEQRILDKALPLLRAYTKDFLEKVFITPALSVDQAWRDKAKAWLAGDGITNQGRVRSDNIASKSADGLLFRSEPEIFFYRALKSLGVSFAPLPVFVRGGEKYSRIEPDFLIVKDGILLVVEIDGDTVHHETPVEAHNRTTMLAHEGVQIERVRASECETQELADICARKILQIVGKLKSSR